MPYSEICLINCVKVSDAKMIDVKIITPNVKTSSSCFKIYLSKIDKESFILISKYIINNASKEFSVQSIVDYYNLNNQDGIYRKMVYRYLEKLEQACLISRVKRYDIATKRTLKQVEKQFVVDNGFLLACNDSNKIFVAHALENLVYNELLYRGYDVKIGKTYKY